MAYIKPNDVEGYNEAPEWLKKWIRVFGNVWPYDNRAYWGDLVFSHKIKVMIGQISEEDSEKKLGELMAIASARPEQIIRNRVNPLLSSVHDLVYSSENAAAWQRYGNGTLVDEDDVAEWYGEQLLQESNKSKT